MSGFIQLDQSMAGDPAICEWMRRHGIDPDDVLADGGWVVIDRVQHRVEFCEIVRDANGRPQLDPDVPDQILTRKGVRQLEAAPLPWPA